MFMEKGYSLTKRWTKNILDFLSRLPVQTKLFLILGLVFGILFVFVSHPMQAPDEPSHFWRAYSVSDLQVRTKEFSGKRHGYTLPDNIISIGSTFALLQDRNQTIPLGTLKQFALQRESQAKHDVYFENTAAYPPVPYIPQAIGIRLARSLRLNVLAIFYSARLMNLLVFLIVIALSITITPIGKWILLVVSLLPMTLFEASSASPDQLIFSMSCLCVAYFFYLLKKRSLGYQALSAALLITTVLSLTKPAYFIVGYVFLMLPARSFKSRTWHICFKLLILGMPLLFVGLWNMAIKGVAASIAASFKAGEYVNMHDQAKFVLLHPHKLLFAIVYTLGYKYSFSLGLGVLGMLGWLKIALPFYCYVILIGLLAAAMYKDRQEAIKQKIAVPRHTLYGLIAIAITLVFAIVSILYLTFTSVGSSIVGGLQGRYFIPVLYLALPAAMYLIPIVPSKKQTPSWKLFGLGIAFVLTVSLCTLLMVNFQQVFPV